MRSPRPPLEAIRYRGHPGVPPPAARYRVWFTFYFDTLRTAAAQPGMQAVTVISITSSGLLSDATVTVVRAGLLVGKYFAYSSL